MFFGGRGRDQNGVFENQEMSRISNVGEIRGLDPPIRGIMTIDTQLPSYIIYGCGQYVV